MAKRDREREEGKGRGRERERKREKERFTQDKTQLHGHAPRALSVP
jgi:hypothetical protein